MLVPLEKDVPWFKTRDQSRKQDREDDLRDLGESLRVRQLQPVGALADGTLIWGHRRLQAAKLVGLARLTTVILDEPMTETQFRLLQATENIHRVDLTSHERAKICEELRRLNPQWQAKDLAENLKISASVVTKLLSASRCIEAVQTAFADRSLSLNETYAISQLSESEQQAALNLKLNGVTRDALSNHVRQRKSPASSEIRLSRVVCPLPTGVNITISGPSLALEGVLDALSDLQREARRARDQLLDVKVFSAVLRQKARSQGKTPCS